MPLHSPTLPLLHSLISHSMSILTVSSLSKSYDPVDIFSGVTFSLPHKGRYAIVGANGVGKTTLLRILAGREPASAGKFFFAKGIQIGYLQQEAAVHAEHSLWEECMTAFGNLQGMADELAQLETAMSSPNGGEEALAQYGQLQAAFEHAGGYTFELRTRQILTGLGFTEADYAMPLPKLSGGQRTRAVLARLLLSNHDMLLLDEPTNHLDIAAVEWLEGFLRDWDGATLIVSHDRYFIDRVATHILEMDRGHMEMYRGNYTAYLQQREARWDLRQQFFESEKARLEKELDYIKRNIAGQNVTQAKGKLRRLSRYLEAVEQVGFEGVRGKKWSEIAAKVDYGYPMGVAEAESRIKALRGPGRRPQRLHLQLTPRKRSGKIILRTYDLEVGYPGNRLFGTDDIEFHRLGCAAVIGPNGSGKSTFLKTILQQIPPVGGETVLGASLDVAYFAQAHEDLNPNRTLMEEIEAVSSMLPGAIRNYLAKFQFRGDDVFKQVLVLSGGERGRLALAKLALTDANLLLLDEPTNHLDIPAQEILQEVLAAFKGTILLVSHDRYLIDALATQIWEIHPRRGQLETFEGTYTEYRTMQIAAGGERVERADYASRREARAQGTRAKNQALAEARRREKRLAKLETMIATLDEQLASLGTKLANPPADPVKVQEWGEEYVRVESSLNALMDEWEGLNQ